MSTTDCLIVFGPLIAMAFGMALGLCFISRDEVL
jgi:hypothetical protein